MYGKTETEKSLVTWCVSREAYRVAAANNVFLQYAYVDCSDYQTDAKVGREMAHELTDALYVETDVLRVGIATSDYRDIT